MKRIPKGFIEITVLDKGTERAILAVKSIESICTYNRKTRITVANDAYYEVLESFDEILKRIEESQDA